MPVLKNVRHEAFAQGLASGMYQGEAYLAAGYKCKQESANVSSTRLLISNPKITERKNEIINETLAAQIAEKAKASLPPEWAIKQHFETFKKARSRGDLLMATRAVDMISKLNGHYKNTEGFEGSISINIDLNEKPDEGI